MGIAYCSESKIRIFCLYDFQSHHPLRSLLLHVNYIQLQRGSRNFHGLTIKTKRILGLEPVQIQVKIIMTCLTVRFWLLTQESCCHRKFWIKTRLKWENALFSMYYTCLWLRVFTYNFKRTLAINIFWQQNERRKKFRNNFINWWKKLIMKKRKINTKAFFTIDYTFFFIK